MDQVSAFLPKKRLQQLLDFIMPQEIAGEVKADSTNTALNNSSSVWKLVMLGLCMMWATNFAVVKIILNHHVPPPIYASCRFSLAALAFLPSTIKCFRNKELLYRSALIGLCLFIAYFGQALGLQTSTANKVCFYV